MRVEALFEGWETGVEANLTCGEMLEQYLDLCLSVPHALSPGSLLGYRRVVVCYDMRWPWRSHGSVRDCWRALGS